MVKARVVRKALCSKGFEEDEKRDHYYYFLHYDGRKSAVHTKISHGQIDLNGHLCGMMARQIRLTASQFQQLIECGLTRDAYFALLIEAGHLVPRIPDDA